MTERKNKEVKEVVYDTVARHLGLRRQELNEMTSLDDPGAFYRIIVDIEQQLGIGTFEGDWCFEEGSLNGLVDYYSDLVENHA